MDLTLLLGNTRGHNWGTKEGHRLHFYKLGIATPIGSRRDLFPIFASVIAPMATENLYLYRLWPFESGAFSNVEHYFSWPVLIR